NNNGTVTVAPNTPAGTYTVSYTVCERLNSASNCNTVTSTLTIGTGSLTVTPVTPLTVPNGALGGTTTQSILTGVTLNGTPNPSVNSVTISFSGLPAGVTTDTQGRLVVAPNTPATDTTISYRVCEKVNPSNCQTASTRLVIGTGSLTVTPTPMTLPNGNAGGTTTPSVLTGVVLNGQPVTDTTSVTLTWNTLPPGATGNNNGTVTVAPNTPAGTYTVSYTICERLNSASNCNTVTSTLTIGTGSLTVTPVTPLTVPNGALGGTTTQSILTGVTLNGTPNPSVNSVTISFSGLPAGVTTDTQGRLVVAPNTPATDTTISYRVCEKVNPSNCQTASTRLVIGTGSLTVTPTPMTLPNGNAGGTTTPSVLTGVVLNGQPVTDTTSVTLTWNTLPPGATGNNNGTVTVAPNTPAGTYTVSYTICERLNSASNNCKTVTSTLTIAPNALTVQSDTFTVTPNGTGTQTTPSVLDNDRIGTQTPTAGAGGTVTITNIVPATPSTAGAKVPSLNPDTGRVEVPANTPAGTYTISYQVCETLNPTNCGPRQTVTVTVTNGTLTVTSTELRVANGSTGGSSVNSVLGGVTLNGQTPPSTSSVTISWNSLPPSFTGNTNGTVSVPAGTASGTYTMTYTVCESLNGTGNCKTVSGTIKVGSGEIVVTPVPLNVANGTTGGTTTPSVLTGVTLNGQTPANTNSVTLTWNQLPPNSVGNTDGTITVHPNTPAGTYTVSYTVCERLNSGSNCETVTNTITIGGGAFTVTPVTQITVPNGANGGTTTPSVLDGVTLNGQTPTTGPTGNVTLTWNQLPPNATGNPDGTVTIAPNTPAGTYTASYTICERLNGNNNCHTYTTTVQVGTPDLSISPKTYLIPNAAVGGTTSSVLENVTYNGQNPPTTSSVTLTFGSLPSGITTTTNGGLQVTPGTPAGVYSVSYTVCEVLNPSHCVNGVATIAVGNVPVVRPDSFTHSGTSTSTTPSVLDNDTVGTQSATAGVGGNVTITNIQVTPQHPGQPGPTMNPNDGRITVPGDTPAGVYTITYDVCTTATPSTCISGVATLTVPQPTPVLPNNNMVYTNTTTTTAGNILDGGKVGTQTATAGNGGNVTITITEPATPKEPGATVPTLDPNTGQITVPAGTPTGTYTITYQVCTTATPTSCTTGIATVTVSGTTGAVPPAGDVTANTLINTPVDVPVLPAGTATGSVTIGVPTAPAHGTTTINPDGTITYQPDRDFVGTDSFVYELCNASGCHSGTVTVEVSSELKIYNAISLTGSGRNDHFHIGGIENYPNNVVRIYNRWGVEVFKVEGYDNVTKVFKGISEGRSTVEPADKLPQGTYYYLIEYQDDRNNTYTKVGWLYLKK
ncbi:MAG: gliding motility-associated C-terminal domain-containing protein, partial [Capnocytophaga sp.]|uniref:T9SS type B sorting domain-containing protein n=1 Tax=Capnocytophaga sp. TaxID=44737 RepID=UPI003F9EE051